MPGWGQTAGGVFTRVAVGSALLAPSALGGLSPRGLPARRRPPRPRGAAKKNFATNLRRDFDGKVSGKVLPKSSPYFCHIFDTSLAQKTNQHRVCSKPSTRDIGFLCVNPKLGSSLAFRVSGPRPRTRNRKSSLDDIRPHWQRCGKTLPQVCHKFATTMGSGRRVAKSRQNYRKACAPSGKVWQKVRLPWAPREPGAKFF